MMLLMLTVIIGAFVILATYYYGKKQKSKGLVQLFKVVVSLNSILYLGLLLQLVTDQNLNRTGLIVEFMVSTSLFISRFCFLYSFIKLIEVLLYVTLLKTYVKTFNISIVVIVLCYVFAWIEPLFWGSKNISETIMIYTDIIIFVTVLGGGVFLFKTGKQRKFKGYRKEIEFLGLIFLIPMILSVLKWVLNNTELMENSIIERSVLYISVSLFNFMVIIWMFLVKKNIKSIERTFQENNSGDFALKYGISKRELEIIKLISEGKTNRNIADELFISIETVKDHNYNIYLKTGVKNRTQLAKLFIDNSSQL